MYIIIIVRFVCVYCWEDPIRPKKAKEGREGVGRRETEHLQSPGSCDCAMLRALSHTHTLTQTHKHTQRHTTHCVQTTVVCMCGLSMYWSGFMYKQQWQLLHSDKEDRCLQELECGQLACVGLTHPFPL